MKRPKAPARRDARRGAALLLSLLVLLVLVAIISQINIATSTDARVGRNDLYLTTMDLAIESAFLEISETLAADAEGTEESGGGGAEAGGAAEDALGALAGDSGGAGEEEGGGAVDSREDDWANPIRTEINGIRLRILTQDEDSKYNVLTMLSEDELEAQKAYERVVRILDTCRDGTTEDIDESDARAMADQMLAHLRSRTASFLPKPTLLTDDEEDPDFGLPLSLREFVCLESFNEDHFRDYRDEEGVVVHSIGSFLTVWSALTTQSEAQSADGEEEGGGTPAGEEEAPAEVAAGGADGGGLGSGLTGTGQGGQEQGSTGGGPGSGPADTETDGVAVNLNTAPVVVLNALMDDRDVRYRLWDAVLKYRNEEDEEAMEELEGQGEEPPLDEYGDPIVIKKIFESVADLDEFDDYRNLDALLKAELNNLLTVQSHVFSVFITARKPTGVGAGMDFAATKEELLEEEESGQALSRTVRCVFWRRQGEDGWELVPIERWEVLDYMPYEVLDFPDEER